MTRFFLLFVAALLAALQGSAQSLVDHRVRTHLALAREDGIDPEDFAHIFFAFTFRRSLPDWRTALNGIDQLEAVRDIDPLMVSELALIRARLLVDGGQPEEARELFREHGGLSRWWVHGPSSLGELEDFALLATRPPLSEDWRPAAGTDPLGWVRLSGLAWPASRQMLYLATTVNSPVEQPVAVHLGAAQVARVWLNGTEILTTAKPLSRAEDQVAAGAVLHSGTNLLVVAVASESSDWWLRVRLSSPNGGPLSTPVKELDVAPSKRIGSRRKRPEVRSLEAALRRSVERGRSGAEIALAAFLVSRHPQPLESGDSRTACRAARESQPAEARLLEWLMTSEPTAQRTLLEEAIDADPNLVWARIELARWYHRRGLHQNARNILEPVFDEPVAQAVALDLDATRWGPLTVPRLETVSEGAPTCADAGLILARRAVDSKRWDLARKAVQRVATFAPGLPALREVRDELAASCGDGPALKANLDEVLALDPNLAELRIRLSRLESAMGDPGAARHLLEQGLARCPEHAELLMELAALDHQEGHDDTAAELARTVLTIRPQDRRAQRLLELLGGASEDQGWRRDLAAITAMAEASQGSEPAVALLNHIELHFLPGNLTEERIQEVYLIRDAKRATDLTTHPLAYVPERQRLRILAARVLKSDGSEVTAGQRDTQRLSEPELSLYYDTRLRLLRFSSLDDGDLVEIAYILTETAEFNETGPYKGGILRLSKSVPVLLTEVELHGPEAALPVWELAHLDGEPEISELDGIRRVRFAWNNLAARSTDRPPPPSLLTTPHLAYSNHSSWGELSDWYGRHIGARIRPSRLVEETAVRLVEGIDDRLQRIARLYRFVTDEIRYVGLEFGEHRFRPFSADWVLNHALGDCKDKATLLVALLGAVDIPARVVMLRTSDQGPVEASIAVLQDFNHAIVYLPDDDLWLDGTATGHDAFPPPSMDQGAFALVVDGPLSSPVTTPRPGAGVAGSSYELTAGDPGWIRLHIRTEDTGEAADSRRALFSGTSDRRRYASWVQGQFPGAELLADPELRLRPGVSPAVMELEARMPRTALLSSRGMSTFPGEFDLASRLAPGGQRSSPLLVPVRPDLRWSVKVKLGPVADLPEDVNLTTPFGWLRLSFTSTGDGYRLDGNFHLEPGLVPASAAADLRSFLVTTERHLSAPLEVP